MQVIVKLGHYDTRRGGIPGLSVLSVVVRVIGRLLFSTGQYGAICALDHYGTRHGGIPGLKFEMI